LEECRREGKMVPQMTLLSEGLEVYHARAGSSLEEGRDSAKINLVIVIAMVEVKCWSCEGEVETLKDGWLMGGRRKGGKEGFCRWCRRELRNLSTNQSEKMTLPNKAIEAVLKDPGDVGLDGQSHLSH
jgi:hypothetical protein